ncbi:S-adenosylmethionine decarboxylase [Siccationidurans ginsengisoli]|nr:S-adenosylmethionine decarboxylase [Hymenobacter sp. BT559]MBO2030502.1 S-adenosylmethionine decarboxylase [Hymenobacter sp. BT559]
MPLAPPRALPPPYAPGLHVLATFGAPTARLQDAAGSRLFFSDLVTQLGLTCVGEVYHTFADSGGFTAVLALTESHLSIHTWPEHGLATFDVFLSNFRHDNHATVRRAYAETLAFFEGEAQAYAEVLR